MSNIRTYEITHCEQKLFPIQQKDSTDYFIGGSLVMKNGKIDKVLFDGGYAQASVVSNTTKDKFAFNFYNQDHLGNNREVVDAKGSCSKLRTTILSVPHTLMQQSSRMPTFSSTSTMARNLIECMVLTHIARGIPLK